MSDRTRTPLAPTGATRVLRHPAPGVIDQRQQQIDPAGRHRNDPDERPDENTKQPGGSPDGCPDPTNAGE